ncbi:hypothetical protein [Streptomyces bacillaris]|uniref:hypothetical protein n=1 Tax=Streptomyces bacillaris TaxID=68179 RepID=UPI0036271F49
MTYAMGSSPPGRHRNRRTAHPRSSENADPEKFGGGRPAHFSGHGVREKAQNLKSSQKLRISEPGKFGPYGERAELKNSQKCGIEVFGWAADRDFAEKFDWPRTKKDAPEWIYQP